MVTVSTLRRSTSAALAGLVVAAGLTVAGAAPAEAAPVRACKASVSVKQPRQYTTTVVNVSAVGRGAKVTTRAKYRTTTNAKSTTATTRGMAAVRYPIAGATPGRTVWVDVVATASGTTWKCSTSFTPRHK